ncbi:hypothetical protein MNBD_CHLOROFLEXI01-3547 [hydrothermal vent metagenome]|uniref:Signal transduction histidine kinase subgroup 3 dimerisation and phosphoacceptor domain-containing protein n=1 Tax=hydrothermal vent metagenome TaxID=652676 RepID=A0A3B0UUS0_9ZZZZ
MAHLILQWFMRHAKDTRAPLPIGLSYMIFSIIVWFLLIRIHPIYYLILFGLFSQVYIVLPLRHADVGSLVIVFMMAYNQTVDSREPFSWQIGLIYLLMGGGSILLGSWISAIINQSEERRELLNRLQATQVELAEAERQAGTLAERQRLAHEIHDTLAQGFISIIMHLETANKPCPTQMKERSPHKSV